MASWRQILRQYYRGNRRGVEALRDATMSPFLLTWSAETLRKLSARSVAHCRSRRPHFRSCWVLRGFLGEG